MMSSPEAERLTRTVFQVIETSVGEASSLDGLSQLEADLLATVTAIGIVGRGGFHSWYRSKGPDDTKRVAEAFDRMSLPGAADAMRRSLAVFPDPAPQDAKACAAYVRSHRAKVAEEFDELDTILWESDYDASLLRHVLAHRQELTEDHPELSAAFLRYDAKLS